MSIMKQSYESYLKSFYSDKGVEYTHTRIGDNNLSIKGGIYTINNTDEFYQKYIKNVFVDGKYEFLTEKQHLEAGPIVVDFDFRYSTEIEEKQHSEEDITNMVDLYSQTIVTLLEIPSSTKIPIFIFEKENVNMLDNITKDGIHMIIGIHMDRNLQIILRNKILTKLNDIWDSLPLENNWDEVLDEGITKGTTNWQLYGSRKPGNESYMLKQYYDIVLDNENDWSLEANDITKFNLKKNFHLLTAQYKNHQSFEMLDSIKNEYEQMKSSSKKKPKNKLKIVNKNKCNDINNVTNKDELDDFIENFLSTISAVNDYNIKETHYYTMCLTDKYYMPYDKWIRVGWALKNTDERLFNTWIAFSAQSPSFEYDKISDFYDMWSRWEGKNEDGLTFRSIIYWAKLDNPVKYKEIREETIDYFIEKTIESPTDFDFALVLYQIYKDDFVCAALKKDIWYIYKNNRWEENEGGTDLRLAISRELHTIYFNKIIALNDLLKSGTIEATSEKYKDIQGVARKIADICKELKKRGSKDNIMREAKEIFYDKNFIEKVDSNSRLLCFNNGIIDFNNRCFRAGKPDDYLSKTTNINYIKCDTARHKKEIAEINDFMEKLFPEAELRNYIWKHLASTLIGENNDQTFNIYNGSGSNGKSKLVELMGLCLGDYKATVPITLITAKRNSIGSTSSEIVQLKGARYAVMQEPSKGDKINEGILKEITGGDPLQGRALFKDSITFIPQFKLVVCTNTLMDVGSNDEGTWRRICVCEFKSKFTPKENFKSNVDYQQYELDKKLGHKFPDWAPIFISMLIDIAYKTDGLVELPDCVKACSSRYKNSQDFYSEFIADKVKNTNGGKVKETSLYEVFKSWYQLHHGKNVPKGRDLFEHMTKVFGQKQRGGWQNVSLIYDDYDAAVDEFEEEDEF